MIIVNCVWRQEDIIKAVESTIVDGQNVFKFVKVDGFRMFFDSLLEDIISVRMIKKAINTIPGHEALFFDVVPIINNSMLEGYSKLLYK